MRDRSLATIAALAAMGDDDQLDLYLRRGLESGLTRAQITEALTHLGFYAGWPKATKALAAVSKTTRVTTMSERARCPFSSTSPSRCCSLVLSPEARRSNQSCPAAVSAR